MSEVNLHEVYRPLSMRASPYFPLYGLDRSMENYQITTDVDFQREHVWTEEQQKQFLGFLLSGGEVSPCIMNEGPDGGMVPAEVVDGKQRITACLRWNHDEIPALLPNGRLVWKKDLDRQSITMCRTSIGIRIGIVRMTREECLDLYIRLNSCGVAHTTEEIQRVQALLDTERQKGKNEQRVQPLKAKGSRKA